MHLILHTHIQIYRIYWEKKIIRREKLNIDFVTFTLCYSFIEPVCITKFLERITLSKIKVKRKKKINKITVQSKHLCMEHFIEKCLPEYKSKKIFFYAQFIWMPCYHSTAQTIVNFICDFWLIFRKSFWINTMHTSLFRGVLNYQIIENRMKYTIYILMKTVRMIMAFCRCS